MNTQLAPLGRWLRIYRLENDMKLKEMAEKLGLSSAHLSGVETAKKKVPEDFSDRVSRVFKFYGDQLAEFNIAVEKSKQDFKIEAVSLDRRDVAAALARRFNELPSSDVDDIRKMLGNRKDAK